MIRVKTDLPIEWMRPFILLFLGIFISFDINSQEAKKILDKYLSLALKNSSDLQILELNEKYLDEEIKSIGWQNPKITLGYGIIPIETRTGAQGARVGFQQPLPSWKSLSYQKEMIVGKQKKNTLYQRQRQAEITFQLKSLWIKLYTLRKNTQHNNKKIQNLITIEKYLNESYHSQQSKASEIYELKIIIQKVKSQVLRLESEALQTQNKIKQLIQTPDEIRTPQKIDLPIPKHFIENQSPPPLSSLSPAFLTLLENEMEIQEKSIALSEVQNYFPKLTLGMEYGILNSQNNNPFYLSLGVSIPIFIEKNRATVQTKIIAREKTKRKYLEVKQNLKYDLHFEYQILEKITKEEEEQKKLIDITEELTEQKEKAYQSEEIEYHEYIYMDIRRIDQIILLEEIQAKKWKKIFYIESFLQI